MTKHLSPTAQLLRSSRLFSIPPPLPRPSIEFAVGYGFKHSDTATLPYPIYQAIATPASSRSRGDWGLKRALPIAKANRKALRVKTLDSSERITDYESATDHTMTVEKFEEMGLAFSTPDKDESVANRSFNAFLDEYDFTDKTSASKVDEQDGSIFRQQKPRRWKYKGPDVQVMTEAEFQAYVKKIGSEKKAFNEHLHEVLHHTNLDAKSREAEESDVATKEYIAWLKTMSRKRFASELESCKAQILALDEGREEKKEEFLSWLAELTAHEMQARQQVYLNIYEDASPNGDIDACALFISRLPAEEFLDRWAHALERLSTPERQLVLQPPPPISAFIRFLDVKYTGSYSEDQHRDYLQEAYFAEIDFVKHYSTDEFNLYVSDQIRRWRGDTTDASELNNVMRDFLDMRPTPSVLSKGMELTTGGPVQSGTVNTHPSAGLSYLRTNAIMENHPILGPQMSRTPIEARVLVPKEFDRRRRSKAVIGVAGIVADDTDAASGGDYPFTNTLQLERRGGGKVWVEPKDVRVDSEGRIRLEVTRLTNFNAKHVKLGLLSAPVPVAEEYNPFRKSSGPYAFRNLERLDSQVGTQPDHSSTAARPTQTPARHATNVKLSQLLSQPPKSYPSS